MADYPLVRRGEPAASLFGHKHTALAYIHQNAASIYEQCEVELQYAQGRDLENSLLHIMLSIPGIGCAKGGFVLQMIYGVSGCMDGHNLRRFGVPERAFDNNKVKAKTPLKRWLIVDEYNQLVSNLGGTASLWDSWCTFISDRDPVNYASPDLVSELHLAPLSA